MDDKDRPIEGQVIDFRVTSGGGSAFAGVALTDEEGEIFWVGRSSICSPGRWRPVVSIGERYAEMPRAIRGGQVVGVAQGRVGNRQHFVVDMSFFE